MWFTSDYEWSAKWAIHTSLSHPSLNLNEFFPSEQLRPPAPACAHKQQCSAITLCPLKTCGSSTGSNPYPLCTAGMHVKLNSVWYCVLGQAGLTGWPHLEDLSQKENSSDGTFVVFRIRSITGVDWINIERERDKGIREGKSEDQGHEKAKKM